MVVLLRLGNSMDVVSTVPEEGRVYSLVEQRFTAATGEPVETVMRRIDPRPALPAIIERWLREYRPGLAILLVNQFWYGYLSAPTTLKSRFGPLGPFVAKLAYKAATTPWIADNPLFRTLRRLVRGTVGATYLYEPEQVVESMSACIRLLHRRGVPFAVWSEPDAILADGDARMALQINARRHAIHEPLAALCRELGVPYYLRDVPLDWPAMRDADHVHLNAHGHDLVADMQLPVLLEAWNARSRATVPPAAKEAAGG